MWFTRMTGWSWSMSSKKKVDVRVKADGVADDYARSLVRRMYNRTLVGGVIVPFVGRFEDLIGETLNHGFGPRHVFRSDVVRFGDAWLVVYMISRREIVVVKGVDGQDWLELLTTKGISKVTRELMVKSFYATRDDTRFLCKVSMQWDRWKRAGEVWKSCCLRGCSKERFRKDVDAWRGLWKVRRGVR